MKYLFSNCRQSPWQMPRVFVFFVRYGAWGVGAKPVDLEKMLQGKKRAYAWNWSKAGRFGEDAPRGKEGICLELEQSRWVWRRCSKRKRGHMPGIGAKPVDLEKMLQGEKRAYVWSWSKAGGFGEDAPRGKEGICLKLEQSRWI